MTKHNHTPTTLKPQNGANTAHNEGKFSCYQNGNDGIEINLSDDVINHNQNDDSCTDNSTDDNKSEFLDTLENANTEFLNTLENNKDININLDIGLHLMDWIAIALIALLVVKCTPAYADIISIGQNNTNNVISIGQSNASSVTSNAGSNRNNDFSYALHCKDWILNLTLCNSAFEMQNFENKGLQQSAFSVPQNKDRVSSEMRPFSNSTFQTPNSKNSDKTEQNYHAKKETLKETARKKETNTAGNRKQKKSPNSSDNKGEQGLEVFPVLGNSEQKETLFISNLPLYAYCLQKPSRVCVLFQKVTFNQNKTLVSKYQKSVSFFSNNLINHNFLLKIVSFPKNPLTNSYNRGYDKALSQELVSGKPYRYLLAFFVSKICLDPQSSKGLNTNPLTHLQGKTVISKASNLPTSYNGLTLQNTIASRRICRAVANKTESKTRYPMTFHMVLTQNLLGGLSNA